MNITDEALNKAYQSILQEEMQSAKEKLSPEDLSWIVQQNSTRAGTMKIISITGAGFNVSLNLYKQLRREYFAEELND